MRLSELINDNEIFDAVSPSDIEISKIITDSRKADTGTMFVCLCGGRDDGHEHIKEALLKGAVAVIVQEGVEFEIPAHCRSVRIIKCKDTRRAAARLYNKWYGSPSEKLKIIAVTGTNGKTSTAFMLKAILEGAMYRCGIIGTVECASGGYKLLKDPDVGIANMTTPDPEELYRSLAFMAAHHVDYVIMEASSHALKLHKLDALTFDTGIFTNLSPEHLDFHKSMEDYRDSKAALFGKCRRALINADDGLCEFMKKSSSGDTYTYSAEGSSADFSAENASVSERGISFELRSRDKMMKIRAPLKGRFNLDNILAAASCALLEGISPPVISGVLCAFSGVRGRMEKVKLPKNAGFDAIIDYAHTPDALENLLLSVRGIYNKGQKLVLIFGCGGDRDREKRPVMGAIASRLADHTLITSDNSRSEDPRAIIDEILSGFDKNASCEVILSRREAIEHAVKTARPDDVIVLAGKGHEKYEIDISGRHPFDEEEILINSVKNER